MSMSRYTLEQINNMDADMMRQILRNAEIQAMKADEEKAAELARLTEAEKKAQAELDAFFKMKFEVQGVTPKFHGQY